jgi:hypothetical protein
MESLVAGLDKTAIATDHFPHIAVADALGDELCDRLQAEFPSLELITRGEDPAGSPILNSFELAAGARELVRCRMPIRRPAERGRFAPRLPAGVRAQACLGLTRRTARAAAVRVDQMEVRAP